MKQIIIYFKRRHFAKKIIDATSDRQKYTRLHTLSKHLFYIKKILVENLFNKGEILLIKA